MPDRESGEGHFEFLGGWLCLDFVNTTNFVVEEPSERFTEYADLLVWSQQAGILTEQEAQLLEERAVERPGEAGEVLRRAHALRETLYQLFAAIAVGRPVDDGVLGAFNRELSVALERAQIVSGAEGFEWGWRDAGQALDRMLWVVARSAADLLMSDELDRVGECAGTDCSWLFLDTSRNRSRRWCDMKECGNRAKARRYYRRSQKQDAAGA